jgi:hypothetical protein
VPLCSLVDANAPLRPLHSPNDIAPCSWLWQQGPSAFPFPLAPRSFLQVQLEVSTSAPSIALAAATAGSSQLAHAEARVGAARGIPSSSAGAALGPASLSLFFSALRLRFIAMAAAALPGILAAGGAHGLCRPAQVLLLPCPRVAAPSSSPAVSLSGEASPMAAPIGFARHPVPPPSLDLLRATPSGRCISTSDCNGSDPFLPSRFQNLHASHIHRAPSSATRQQVLHFALPIGVLTSVEIGGTNYALKILHFSFAQILKASGPLFVLIFAGDDWVPRGGGSAVGPRRCRATRQQWAAAGGRGRRACFPTRRQHARG